MNLFIKLAMTGSEMTNLLKLNHNSINASNKTNSLKFIQNSKYNG